MTPTRGLLRRRGTGNDRCRLGAPAPHRHPRRGWHRGVRSIAPHAGSRLRLYLAAWRFSTLSGGIRTVMGDPLQSQDQSIGALETVHTFGDGPMLTGVSVAATGRAFVKFPK